jgi:uncharacterized protein DUF6883
VIFLPNAANVVIEPQKLYYLFTDPGKSNFFTTMMGFHWSRRHELDAALRQHVLINEITEAIITTHGAKFNVRCTMPSPNGRNLCTFSCWIFDLGKVEARLVTAYASPP